MSNNETSWGWPGLRNGRTSDRVLSQAVTAQQQQQKKICSVMGHQLIKTSSKNQAIEQEIALEMNSQAFGYLLGAPGSGEQSYKTIHFKLNLNTILLLFWPHPL